MKTLTLKNKCQTDVTLISNHFIDCHMIQANGEFVKVYLFLLRHLENPGAGLTISAIADCLDHTERDILRAFRYWESEGLLSLEEAPDGTITGLVLESDCAAAQAAASDSKAAPDAASLSPAGAMPHSFMDTDTDSFTDAGTDNFADAVTDAFNDSAKPTVSNLSANEKPAVSGTVSTDTKPTVSNAVSLDTFKAQKELKSLLFIAEQYLGKTLTKTDVDAITYFYDHLQLPADLIEYLIESCVENGHKSIHYIQKVALSWYDDGIRTIDAARSRTRSYHKNCYTVLNAFGIKNRGPADSELAYIRKWTDELGFTIDMVQEACNRTISATHQPSFEYADTILTKWHASKVRTLQQVAVLDAAFQKEKSSRKPAVSRPKAASRNLNNFERRTYDMESLEEQLLNSN